MEQWGKYSRHKDSLLISNLDEAEACHTQINMKNENFGITQRAIK